MTINKLDTKAFALALLDTYNFNGYGIDKEVAIKELQREIEEDFIDLNTEETKLARWQRFKREGVSLQDFSEKVLNLGESRKVIYGIRHMNGNINIPFINLIANFSISSKEDALEIYKNICDEFKNFSPKFLSFFSAQKIEADFYGDTYMCATASTMKARDPWNSEAEIDLIRVEDESYYAWYEKGYAQFNKDVPELAYKVRANSREVMNESLDEELLYYAFYQGRRIGLIAAVRSKLLGHDGFYFNEIYLEKEFKGKGLAKALQRIFVAKFASDNPIVWGTIDASNLPSYKTAFSNGRRPIRFECFVKL
ncbi:hypothetical protein [Halobacteriovorax sp. DPLXC-1]|uniref:hypothetical protein n=1 Tax=Halobacteriovorax sp. DPLXC-1 TaxID=3110771 RepID=UPI002FF29EE8